MKLGIQTRLFIAFMGTITLAVIAMALAVNWSFERGFVDYLQKVELERLDPLVRTLGQAYGQENSWDFLRHNPRVWKRLLDQGLGEQNPVFRDGSAES